MFAIDTNDVLIKVLNIKGRTPTGMRPASLDVNRFRMRSLQNGRARCDWTKKHARIAVGATNIMSQGYEAINLAIPPTFHTQLAGHLL